MVIMVRLILVLMVIIVRIHRAHGNHGTGLNRAELYQSMLHGGILGSHGIHGNFHDVMVIRVLFQTVHI